MSVYKVIELVGRSDVSWEDAAKTIVETASKTIRDLRVAEVTEMDVKLDEGKPYYRVKMKVSFKYQGS